MKSAIVGSAALVLCIVTFLIIASLQINTNIHDELNNSVDHAVYQAQRVLFDKRKEIKSNDAFLGEFNEALKKQLNPTDQIHYAVDVYGVDYQKGLLDVGVTARYNNLYGQAREIRTRRTMIIEVLPTLPEKKGK